MNIWVHGTVYYSFQSCITSVSLEENSKKQYLQCLKFAMYFFLLFWVALQWRFPMIIFKINIAYYGGSNPYTEARRALAECRGSCRRHYAHLQGDQLPDLIKLFGGLEDYVVDLFGFKLDLCNPSNLFTSRARSWKVTKQ